MKKSWQISGLLAALLVVSGGALAAGLGRMSIQSALGQPLRAEIELLSVQADELGMVEAKLASPDAYRQARIDRTESVSGLRFSVDRRPDGQPVVRVHSLSPVNEPFMDVLIELNWSSGRIIREYTMLLDPAPEPAAQADTGPLQARIAPETAPPPLSRTSSAADQDKRVARGEAVPEQVAKVYGPVKAGETLRSIAAKVVPPDVTLDMMIASLYQANRQAFAKNNMNLLKKGQELRVPERDAIMIMFSPHQAKKLIGQHARAWQAFQERVAEQAERAVAEPATDKSAGTGRVVRSQPQEQAPAPTASKDVLRLSKGEPTVAQPDTGSAKRIQSMEEELASRNRALQEAQSRVQQLEKTVSDLQRLMALKGKDTAKAVEGPAAKPPTTPAPAQADQVKKSDAKAQDKPAAIPPPDEEPGFLATLMANPLYIGGAVAAILLGILLWVVLVGSRRRKGLSDFEQSIMSGGDQFKTSIFKTGSGASSQAGTATQSGMATDFSRLGLGSIDTHEVDPIAEAEVYMAYGRDAQAEEILKEALAKDPSRHEIALKLLEIYATRQDKASFETQASELYAAIGGVGNPIWHKAAEMGRKLDPDNPLYRVFGEMPAMPGQPAEAVAAKAAEPVPPPPAAVAETGITTVQPQPPEDEQVIEFDIAEAAGSPQDMAEVEETPNPPEETPMDFDLSEFQALEEKGVQATAVGAGSESAQAFPPLQNVAVGNLEEVGQTLLEPPEEPVVDLGGDQPVPLPVGIEVGPVDTDVSAPAEPGIVLPELDFSGIDLDLADMEAAPKRDTTGAETGTDAASGLAGIEAPADIDPDILEEVNTKLDLAKAYLEMGDKEGAREILDEILKEGDARQRREASDLMAELS